MALSIPGANQYGVWYTDSSGNFTSDPIGVVSGTSTALESFETSFQQDLNGDGTIGPPPPPPPPALTVIESYGTTSLLTDGTHYFLQPAGGSAVELSYGGAPVYTGEYGGWTWIGAEQTANGYEVALSIPGANQYGVWYTDSSGNFTSDPIGVVSGTSTALKSFETSFQQDLNGDGTIGPPPPPAARPDGDRVIRNDQPADGRDPLFSSTGWRVGG